MRWQRAARVGFALVGVGCAVAIAVQFRPRPKPADVAAPVKHDPAAQVETGKGQSVQWGTDGKEEWRIGFGSSAGYQDGHTVFRQAHFYSARPDRAFDILADQAETAGKAGRGVGPADIHLTGHVRITTSDHWQIQSETARYADATGVLEIPGTMTFTRDRISGDSQGATYDRINAILVLLSQAHFTTAADSTGAGALDAKASRMTLARTMKSAHLEGDARIVRDTEVLAADDESMIFTDDEKGLKQLDLRGHASVTPQPGAKTAPPDMRADIINLAIYPDGRTLQRAGLRGQAAVLLASDTGTKTIAAPAVDVTLARDGQTVTRLNGNGGVTVQLPPTPDTPTARTITAPTLAASGDEKAGLKSAVFSGNVTFVEHGTAAAGKPAQDRTGTSKILALKLNGDLGAVDEAEFRQTVHFVDGDVTADADHATYAEAKNQLTLDAGDPTVVNGDVTVYGERILLATDTHDVTATGKAQTVSKPSPSGGTSKSTSPGLFDAGQPVYGSGAKLTYVSATQRATYTGSDTERARVLQNSSNSDVKGDTVVVEQQTNNLRATGHVESLFATDSKSTSGKPAAAPATPAAPTVYHAKAQELVYTDANRTAHYTGGADAAELKGPDGTTTAKTIDVVLASESRTVQKMRADGDVHLTSDGGREARGEHLTYDAARDEYHLTGKQARAVLPQSGSSPGAQPQCMLYSGTDLTFGSGGFATASAGSEPVTSRRWTCGTPIPIK